MSPWTGIVLALDELGDDGMESRLSTYLHPLAGRPLAWHSLSCVASLDPAPSRLVLLVSGEWNAELFGEHAGNMQRFDPTHRDLAQAVRELDGATDGNFLLVDAAAIVAAPELRRLVEGPVDRILVDGPGRCIAAWLSAERVRELLDGVTGLRSLSRGMPAAQGSEASSATVVVHDRATLSRASMVIRDRLVRHLMNAGVSFLLPETILVDVDVRIGRDSVIYPGVVLEGQTSIGEETVVGPGCRVIDSWIGSGVELKGWNYLANTSIRNRAILEPYVRRGFD